MSIDQFLQIFTTIPTAFFSVFFCVFFLYWTIGALLGFDQNLGMEIDGFNPSEIGLSKIIISFGLSKVPLSVGLSIASLTGTILSFIFQYLVMTLFFDYNDKFNPYDPIYFALSLCIFSVLLFFSLWLTGYFIKPLIPFFDDSDQRLLFSYIGREATVSSLKVSDKFGEVILKDDSGLEHRIIVYSKEESNTIKKGDLVLIISHDKEQNRYLVNQFN
jgi:hypothetical protein